MHCRNCFKFCECMCSDFLRRTDRDIHCNNFTLLGHRSLTFHLLPKRFAKESCFLLSRHKSSWLLLKQPSDLAFLKYRIVNCISLQKDATYTPAQSFAKIWGMLAIWPGLANTRKAKRKNIRLQHYTAMWRIFNSFVYTNSKVSLSWSRAIGKGIYWEISLLRNAHIQQEINVTGSNPISVGPKPRESEHNKYARPMRQTKEDIK